jgi:hypothetical protein
MFFYISCIRFQIIYPVDSFILEYVISPSADRLCHNTAGVYRQQDASFIEILNPVRGGHPSQEALLRLNGRVNASLGRPFIRLTTHNNLANYYNESEPGRSCRAGSSSSGQR